MGYSKLEAAGKNKSVSEGIKNSLSFQSPYSLCCTVLGGHTILQQNTSQQSVSSYDSEAELTATFPVWFFFCLKISICWSCSFSQDCIYFRKQPSWQHRIRQLLVKMWETTFITTVTCFPDHLPGLQEEKKAQNCAQQLILYIIFLISGFKFQLGLIHRRS